MARHLGFSFANTGACAQAQVHHSLLVIMLKDKLVEEFLFLRHRNWRHLGTVCSVERGGGERFSALWGMN